MVPQWHASFQCMCAIITSPLTLCTGAYFKLFGRHIDTNVPAAYSDDHWKKVIAQINLSDEQVGPACHPLLEPGF